ncbi:MAG: RHS repeat-associated core domain-containing protein, partial [Spirochaetia bacterium]|nr:RHS repeat-associated core domain-containing protein [Spirochaetia bacterium]
EKIVHEYLYDDLNRLVRSKLTHTNQVKYDQAFAYDETGNILAKDTDSLTTPSLGNRGYSYAKAHQVSGYTGEKGADLAATYAFTYDLNGNMATKSLTGSTPLTANESWQYGWDADNHLKTVSKNGQVIDRFTYDHTGERAAKLDKNGKTTLYVGGLSQITPNGDLQYFIFDGVNRIAAVKKTTLASTPNVFFMHTDNVGSTTMVTKGNAIELGQVEQKLDYKAFGQIYQQWKDGNWSMQFDASVPGGYAFTGQELDSDTGLYYYGFRYFDANSGRFISSDTIIDGVFNTQGFNRYSYVKNNPLRYSDPSGHSAEDGMGGEGGGDGGWQSPDPDPPQEYEPPVITVETTVTEIKNAEGDVLGTVTQVTYSYTDGNGNLVTGEIWQITTTEGETTQGSIESQTSPDGNATAINSTEGRIDENGDYQQTGESGIAGYVNQE